MKNLDKIMPGKILQEKFMKPRGITAYRLAKEINVPANRIYMIINGKRSITADTAQKLADYFGNTLQYWLKIQHEYYVAIYTMQLTKAGK